MTFIAHPYRTALALNNMAVTLMQRGRYASAVKTLNDSLKMVRLSCELSNGENPVSKESDIFLHATKRFSRALECGDCKGCSGAFEINAIDDEDLAGLRSAAKYGPSSTVVFPVRISESPDAEMDTKDMTRQFGIILYNHGVAYFLASNPHSGGKSGKFMRRSQKSLKMAESSLLSLVEDEETGGDPSALLLSAMVLSSMSVLYHYQNLSCQAEEALHVVTLLCASFDEDFITSLLVQRHFAPAA